MEMIFALHRPWPVLSYELAYTEARGNFNYIV